MVLFASYDDLRRIQQPLVANSRSTKQVIKRMATAQHYGVRTFLSHSSKDSEFLPAVIDILNSNGANVYCDLMDERMPKPPSKETAVILKNEIRNSRKLVLFVTKNSADSKWVPWELGLGDALLNNYNVALFPSAEDGSIQSWARAEYLGLYQEIVWGKIQGREDRSKWLVYDHGKHSASYLEEWLMA